MSIHDLMIDQAHQAIAAHPLAWSKIMRTTRERLNDDPGFRNDFRAFSDVPAHVRDFQAEWYYALQCRTSVLMGDILCCGVEIRATPLADAQMEENNRLLQAGLHHPFFGEAARELDSDGYIGWRAPITITQFVRRGRRIDTVLTQAAPWTACLEVGYTHGYRSYLHLWQESSLARWCYGDAHIQIFKMTDRAMSAHHKALESFISGKDKFVPVDLDAVKAAVEQLALWN